jgi:hypothetical protein
VRVDFMSSREDVFYESIPIIKNEFLGIDKKLI